MKANFLGDTRAEVDHEMLTAAFYESPDYLSIVGSRDKTVIVGRRGSGKSALVYKLERVWNQGDKSKVVTVLPEDHHMLAFKGFCDKLGESFTRKKAASKLIWRYALFLEIAEVLADHFRFRSAKGDDILNKHRHRWRKYGSTTLDRIVGLIRDIPKWPECEDLDIGTLPRALELSQLQPLIADCWQDVDRTVNLLIDRLDEGFERDESGLASVAGIIDAASDLQNRFPKCRVVIFLRDNIARNLERVDDDYSRNIEGQTLRLHWDEYSLLNLIGFRIKVACKRREEKSLELWNVLVADDLKHKDGFRQCLRLTLYRPRDLVVLLNESMRRAGAQGGNRIAASHLTATAKSISEGRLSDLIKEYDGHIVCLRELVMSFANGSAHHSGEEAINVVSGATLPLKDDASFMQQLALLGGVAPLVSCLYGIGFFGIREQGRTSYEFCHDGRTPNSRIDNDTKLLVHPCFWLALNVTENPLDREEAEEIHDEYDIKAVSDAIERRTDDIQRLISGLKSIAVGIEGASHFEEWCRDVVVRVFAGELLNVELHPNKSATDRRDIVGTNNALSPSWKRIREDYGSRQVVFEVKNFDHEFGPDEARQALAYSHGIYGKIIFIITRHASENPAKGKELDNIRNIYANHDRRLIVKLTAGVLCRYLEKLKAPQKHNEPDRLLGKLLDNYERMYICS
jgi:hypothetical protein